MTTQTVAAHFAGLSAVTPFRMPLSAANGNDAGHQDSDARVHVWKRNISMRIEPSPSTEGAEIIRFVGGVPGHDSFRLDKLFVEALQSGGERDWQPERWYLSPGVTGRFDSCWVSRWDVLTYLEAYRPTLFARPTSESVPSGMGR